MDNNKNIEIIVKLLKDNDLNHIVISPGGTNQAFVKAVQNDEFFHCYSIVDERSAIYFAIGLYLQLKKPIITSCTSAQATRNYVPGLTEAFYKRVPILSITMCKHPRFNYQEYMQAPNQISLPEDCVKKSFMLPCVSDSNDVLHSVRIVNDAILELSRNGYGPVQLCCPWLDFPLKSDNVSFKTVRRISSTNIEGISLRNKKVMLCIGEHLPFSAEEKMVIEEFCSKYDVVVYTNHLSNYSGAYSISGTIKLLTIDFEFFVKKLKPDILITIGGQTGDYPFFNLFSRNDITGVEHWRICDDGKICDTYDKLTKVFQIDEIDFFKALNTMIDDEVNHDFYLKWKSYFDTAVLNCDVPFSAVSIAQDLGQVLPKNSIIQFSILNSLRIWNMFPLDQSIESYSNVGAFGIDGGMSTLIGQSVVTEKKTFMIIGDLAFLYDMNSISIRHIKSNLRILVVNNAGGMEFKLWGGDLRSIDKYIAAAGHFKNAKGWSETCGFKYMSAKTREEFKELMPVFVGESDKPIILEVFLSDNDEADAYNIMIQSNKNLSIQEKAKRIIKGFLNRK